MNNLPRVVREVERPGLEPATYWLQVRRFNHCCAMPQCYYINEYKSSNAVTSSGSRIYCTNKYGKHYELQLLLLLLLFLPNTTKPKVNKVIIIIIFFFLFFFLNPRKNEGGKKIKKSRKRFEVEN